jgi:exoribonuclease-2
MLVINQVEALKSRRIISELMIIANLHCSKYFIANGLTGIFRSQKKSNNLETSIIDENPPFCFHRKVSPLDVSIRPEPHYGLGLKSYMQITSPIRRYFDSINMWQISYFISERRALYDEKEIQTILTTMLPQIATVREKSKKVYKLWILRYLEQIEAKNISGYIYASLKDKYIVFFNELNFFESISKEKCRNLYEKDDFIELSFDFVDIQNLELINLKD